MFVQSSFQLSLSDLKEPPMNIIKVIIHIGILVVWPKSGENDIGCTKKKTSIMQKYAR